MCGIEQAMQKSAWGWGGGNILNTVWKDHEVGKQIEEMNENWCGWSRVSPEGMLKIKMELDIEGYSQGVLRLKCLQSMHIYLWKNGEILELYYKYNGKLLKGFMLGSIMIQFMWQKCYSWEEKQVFMATILRWRQTRGKEVGGLQAYWKGRMADILVKWMCKLWEAWLLGFWLQEPEKWYCSLFP